MPEYRIRYKDGRTQNVTADTYRTGSDFVYFDRGGSWCHQVATSEVESVGYADIPEPTRPSVVPKSVAV